VSIPKPSPSCPIFRVKPSLRVTVTLKGFGPRPINGASILVNRTRSKQLFHTSQNRPSFCAFYWVTTFPSAKRVSGWPRERNIGGVTGELRRLGLKWAESSEYVLFQKARSVVPDRPPTLHWLIRKTHTSHTTVGNTGLAWAISFRKSPYRPSVGAFTLSRYRAGGLLGTAES